MTRELKANWDYALANAPPGLLRKIDRAMLTVWVVAEDTHRRAAQLLDTTRTLLMRQDGEAKPFPSLYLGIMNKQALILAKVVAELGFSPCSRVRLFANTGPPSNSAPILNADSGDNVIPLRRYIQNAPPRPLRAG
jgi:phage terminase small subunit